MTPGNGGAEWEVRWLAGWVIGALALAGCGAVWPSVEEAQWVRSVGAPKVKRVRDLGTRKPPHTGALQGESDGVAAPGEYLLIEGSGFGRSPAVTIDGRAAEVVARTEGAGIVARVPERISPGVRPVVVSVGESRSELPFALRRLVVALHGGELRAFSVSGNGDALEPVGQPLALPGARAMALSADGACAYVIDRAGKRLLVVDLGAPGGLKIVATRDLAVPATKLLAAYHAPRVLAIAADAVQIFDVAEPRAPAPYHPTPLPPVVRGALEVDLDRDGNRLAFTLPEGNRVAVVDVTRPDRPRLLGEAKVLPEARAPLLRDARFLPEGDLLWVLSGDSTASLAVGTQPTRVSLLELEHADGAPEGELTLTPWMTGQLASAGAPLRLASLRALPPASGATVHLPPEKTAARFTSVPSALLAPGASQPAAGALDQGDATGEGLRLLEPRRLLGTAVGTSDGGALVIPAVRSEAGQRTWGIELVSLGQPPTSTFTPVAPALAAELAPPFALGEVAIQP